MPAGVFRFTRLTVPEKENSGREPDFLEEVVLAGLIGTARLPSIDNILGVLLSPACGEVPEFALLVEHHGARRPGQERRQHQADTFARAGRCDGGDVFRSIVAEVAKLALAIGPCADVDAGHSRHQSVIPDLLLGREPRGAVGIVILARSSAPRIRGSEHPEHAERHRREHSAFDRGKGRRQRRSPRSLLPLEPGPGRVEMAEDGRTEDWVIARLRGDVLCRGTAQGGRPE